MFHYSDIQAMLTSLVLTEKKHKNAKHCWLNLNIPALPIIDQYVLPMDLILGIKMEHLKNIAKKQMSTHWSLQQIRVFILLKYFKSIVGLIYTPSYVYKEFRSYKHCTVQKLD